MKGILGSGEGRGDFLPVKDASLRHGPATAECSLSHFFARLAALCELAHIARLPSADKHRVGKLGWGVRCGNESQLFARSSRSSRAKLIDPGLHRPPWPCRSSLRFAVLCIKLESAKPTLARASMSLGRLVILAGRSSEFKGYILSFDVTALAPRAATLLPSRAPV